jgi:hypothetical protein
VAIEPHTVLQPGEYFTPDFAPRLTFSLREAWWVEREDATSMILAPGSFYRSSENLVIADIERVFPPSNQRKVVAAPKDLLRWFLHHPGLKVLMRPRPVEVGGVRGTEFDVTTVNAPPCVGGGGHCWLITPFGPGDPFAPGELANGPPINLAEIPDGFPERNRLVLLTVQGHRIIVVYDDSPESFPTSVRLLEALLQTVSFG